jgi:hypothetical protein
MTYRKSLVDRKLRIRKTLIQRLDRAAKLEDRSTNDEIARRLDDSFGFEEERRRMAEERERMAEEHRMMAGERQAMATERRVMADERERMAEERMRLIMGSLHDLRTHPNPAATRAALEPMRDSADQYMHDYVAEELEKKASEESKEKKPASRKK